MSSKNIEKILIANRGEIAIRVMRTAKEMGINTVAIYSDADATSPHVAYADEAVNVGPPASSDSYLNTKKILDVCKELNVDAIHPGYGFLSENSNFAQLVEDHGITFIGPSTHAIEVMGDKLAAKNAVSSYNIPMVPGVNHAVKEVKEAKVIAEQIGYPVLIKASAGGGGKGMRVVGHADELDSQMKRAMSEAQSAFGDSSVFVEKYISSPRHIEIQILGDQHGNILYLFERECSIQRRHQKVIEEAPSPVITPEKRKQMGEAAVSVAKACGYYGAGTVEFIMDENLDFFFLEMNTRLQVEHPVTEEITGIDLVKEQIYIAEGRELSFKQEDLKINGHSMEVRVYAENPRENFLPDTGSLNTYSLPQGPGVRVDDGYEQGMEIPIYYDPMISKLITHGANREQARLRMLRAINEYQISGVATTLDFCDFALRHDAFISGEFDTKFVDKYFTPGVLNDESPEKEELAIALAAYIFNERSNSPKRQNGDYNFSKWKLRAKQ